MASIRPYTARNGVRTWKVLYRHGQRQTSRTFESEKSAKQFCSLVTLLGADGAIDSLGGSSPDDRMTLDELAQRFLEWKSRDVTDRTLADYRRDYGNWIKPWLGHRAAQSIDEGDVQRLVDHMSTRLSPKSVADRHMLLHSMFQYGKAKSRGLVSQNPCLETNLPKRVRKPPKGTTLPEFVAILAAAERRNPDARDLILFLGETGWRFSEGTALDVSHVEDDGEDVWVTVGQVFRIDGRGRQILSVDEAKSYAGFRRIRLLSESASMARHRIVGKAPGDLVFTNSRGRPWNQNTFLRETWPRIVADARLGERKPTPHWLRHMHVAVLSAAGAPLQEIQRRIGHESIQTTIDVYGGMIGDVSDGVLRNAGAIMSGRRGAVGLSVGPVVRGETMDVASDSLQPRNPQV